MWDGQRGLRNHVMTFSITPDQPVGYADGSVVAVPRAKMKARALGGPGNNTYDY